MKFLKQPDIKVGDLVCRRTLYTEYYIRKKKIKKEVFNRLVGTVTESNETVVAVKLMNDNVVYSTKGMFMRLENYFADGITFE